MSIRILPQEVASQIAAGEVVERPASVVKELLENALDAGTTAVSIVTRGAGQLMIEVSDNGAGIPPEELPIAVARHATSKLSSVDDLQHIGTLGFRGEALASIGSVSILTITSRPAGSELGARLRVEAGLAGETQFVGAPLGTVARVENLFHNVPARLKFLKSASTERGAIDRLVTSYALAYPQVRFQLQQEDRTALHTSGNGNAREVLAALYGVDVARQMLEVLGEEDGLRVNGFISPTSLTRSNRREITFFVNGRPVQDAGLSTALVQAYHNLLMVGRYPLAFLFVDIDPEAVDVNVHPAKAEVRFRDRDRVFSGVQRAVRRALLAYTPVPGLSLHPTELQSRFHSTWGSERELLQPEGWTASDRAGLEEVSTAAEDTLMDEDLGPGTGSQAGHASVPTPDSTGSPPLSIHGLGILRLIGQVAGTYLAAEGPDGLYLIDQHAAHERVLFEKLMAQRSQNVPSQSLLHPAAVDLPPAGARLISDQLPVLSSLGFQVEPFGSGPRGETTFLVRAIPALLVNSDPASALRVLVEDFEEDETPLEDEIEARIIARVCKRAAVKAGHSLSSEEQRALLADLEACQSPRTCPHGRPTMIHISVDLLERQFGRKGAR